MHQSLPIVIRQGVWITHTFAIVIFLKTSVLGQNNDIFSFKPPKYRSGLMIGIATFKKTSLEIGYGFYMPKALWHINKKRSFGFSDLSLCSEFQIGNKNLWGPKIASSYSYGYISNRQSRLAQILNMTALIFGADYIFYNDLKTINSIIRPLIGLSLFNGGWELSYGYNIRIDKNTPLQINTHIIQLRFKSFRRPVYYALAEFDSDAK